VVLFVPTSRRGGGVVQLLTPTPWLCLRRRSELTSPQRKAFRDASGINSVADASAAMERLPPTFLQAVRAISLVRIPG
jgi:hypothetical protein